MASTIDTGCPSDDSFVSNISHSNCSNSGIGNKSSHSSSTTSLSCGNNHCMDKDGYSMPMMDSGAEEGANTSTSSVDNKQRHLTRAGGLRYLPAWPAVNLEFQNLVFEVTDMSQQQNTSKNVKNSPDKPQTMQKQILHNISGQFRAHELTAIMGPSGSGKTTLLNILAGYGTRKTSGEIYVNSNMRDMKIFRKMSRYIMQNDVLDQHFTALELMLLAANLKLGNELSKEHKLELIDEILCMLRLKKCENTKANRLSGGERKRLCIAMELVNNPSVIFLDEPTTGLDDISSAQCIALLRRIAHSGRTVICSVHTPSAKLFEMFDKVYVLAEGECVYQGAGAYIVPFMRQIGLTCPLTYNPADFIIEVACREYGDEYHDRMVAAVANGKVTRWTPHLDYHRHEKTNSMAKSDTTSGASSLNEEIGQFEEEINPRLLRAKCSWWLQYRLLVNRMLLQMWRDKSYIKLKFFMNIILALIVGGIYIGVGNDATKALFNFGFVLTIVIAYLYLPMMPVLLQFPSEMRLLKREYFNQWYRLSSYYAALITSKLPFLFILATIYLTMVYLMTNQPLELFRFAMLYLIAILTAMTSDSLGLLISSRLSLVNAMFIGPVVAVPLILLSCYGIGYGKEVYVSPFMRFLMSLSYLRHGMEGLIAALYGFDRSDTICPENVLFCMFKKSQFLLMLLGFENLSYVFSICCLFGFYVVFTVAAYILIRLRLTLRTNFVVLQYVARFFQKHLNFTSYNY